MGFAITPMVPAEQRDGLIGNQLQVRDEGSDVGDPNVRVIDFIFDRTKYSVTRGWGENRHVITVRKLPQPPPPPPPPPPPVKKPGWMTDILDPDSAPLHANSGYGKYEDYVSPPGVTIAFATPVYAGIEGYAGETIVWTPTWTPVDGDSSPIVTPISGGRVSITWPYDGIPPNGVEGLLELSTTVDGQASGQSIWMSAGPGWYNVMAWGPTP